MAETRIQGKGVFVYSVSHWVGPHGTARESVTVLDWVRLRNCKEDRSLGGSGENTRLGAGLLLHCSKEAGVKIA